MLISRKGSDATFSFAVNLGVYVKGSEHEDMIARNGEASLCHVSTSARSDGS